MSERVGYYGMRKVSCTRACINFSSELHFVLLQMPVGRGDLWVPIIFCSVLSKMKHATIALGCLYCSVYMELIYY